MNEVRRRGPIASLFVWLWDAMNFTRRLVFNVIFFTLAFLLLVLLFSGGGLRPLEDRTTLVIAPEGRLVEQFSADPVSRALAQGHRRQQRRGSAAARPGARAGSGARRQEDRTRGAAAGQAAAVSGFASMREVAASLQELRASGKQIVAYSDNLSQWQYLLAAQANEIYLDPMGGVVLEGLGRYRQYFRTGLQDKLGVDVHLFKVGEYKSAAEPYVLDAASPQAKEADLFWMNDVWQRYLGRYRQGPQAGRRAAGRRHRHDA
jgi:protease-4